MPRTSKQRPWQLECGMRGAGAAKGGAPAILRAPHSHRACCQPPSGRMLQMPSPSRHRVPSAIPALPCPTSFPLISRYALLTALISDLLEGAFCIPLYVPYVLTGRWPFSRGLCKLWLVVDYLLCTSSVFNIVLISYDRFLSVTRAVSYRAQQGDTRRAVQKMVMVWVLAFLLSSTTAPAAPRGAPSGLARSSGAPSPRRPPRRWRSA
ncbi:histamine h3 receptor [Lynx pardinus]|uniref:Histamine h3 receptor n=1 Tax=Lynx pardinus TaxID=191816 RepID=A0A485PP05_LYNPA|nr:histamine h3 receptor [Lynx pardinus]